MLLSGVASAQEPIIPHSVLPGLGAGDPRQTVELGEAPWYALGRVQTEIGGRCTGALIAARLVLTAAHCLAGRNPGVLVQPASIHFLLGYDRGMAVAHGRVMSYRIGRGFKPPGGGPPDSDWAVLTLDQYVSTADRVLPLMVALPPPRTPLMLGGYQQDRPEVILADTGCRAIGLEAGLVLHDCAGTRGASGAPLLARTAKGGWAIAGVVSRAARDVAMGFAVPSTTIAAALR